MKRLRNKNWFWGTFFILGAILLGASQLNLISYHFSFWSILATLFLAGTFIESVIMRSIGGTLFSLAFLGILYATPLGITQLVPWTILGIALLLTVGLSIIFHPHRRWVERQQWESWHHHSHPYHHHGGQGVQGREVDEETISDDQTEVNIDSRMSSSVRYIQSNNLQRVNIYAYATGLKVYFDKTIVDGELTVNIDAHLSGVDLYFPHTWQVVNNIEAFLGGVSQEADITDSPVKVYLNGDAALSGVNVHYL